MASHLTGQDLLDKHLAALARRLPVDAVAELADGLTETWHHHLARGGTAEQAARQAIADFGTVAEIVEAFVTNAPGRRTARLLIATGPIVGACWAATLLTAQAWTWALPRPLVLGFALALPAVVATLAVAATSRRSHRRTRLCAAGGIGLVALDATALAVALLWAPAFMAPMLLAAVASVIRVGAVLRALPRLLAG